MGRLMIYLSLQLKRWDEQSYLTLDQDYERAGREVKQLVGANGLARKIVPDMVYHRRGSHHADGNLLAVEVKVADRSASFLHDRAKLAVLTGLCDHAQVYPKALRLDGDPRPSVDPPRDWTGPKPPPGQPAGTVGRPTDPLTKEQINPYRYGLWLLVTRQAAQLIWFDATRSKQIPTREDAIPLCET